MKQYPATAIRNVAIAGHNGVERHFLVAAVGDMDVGAALLGGPVSTSGAISRVNRSTGPRSRARTPTLPRACRGCAGRAAGRVHDVCSAAVPGCEFERRLAARKLAERDARKTRRRDACATLLRDE